MVHRLTISSLCASFHRIDARITAVLAWASLPALRLGLGLVFLWFGALKVAGISPAAGLIAATTDWAADPAWFIPMLGWWEVLIGICLIDPIRLFRGPAWLTRAGIFLLVLQMPGTFMPLLVVPQACFTTAPLGLTMEGQYIVKNLVLIAGAIAVGASARDITRHAKRSRATDHPAKHARQ